VGVSLFWKSPFGPLRFNWSVPVVDEPGDVTQNFDLTVASDF